MSEKTFGNIFLNPYVFATINDFNNKQTKVFSDK